MRNLDEIRLDINDVDERLKKLFLERMSYVNEVKDYKAATNTPVKNTAREADILKSKLSGIDKFYDETKSFFKSMIDISCDYQYEMLSDCDEEKPFDNISFDEFITSIKTVCYQGIEGSYSFETATNYFADKEIYNVKTFEEVFKNINNGTYDLGVLPFENLSTGCVSEVYDLLRKNDVYITHYADLSLTHCLAGVGNEADVKAVLSHPQALNQCAEYINNNSLEKIECLNTAVAANSVKNKADKSLAAICSRKCAELYSLNILKENISNISNNKTKFIFITKNRITVGTPTRASIIFTAKHELGSLSRILNHFAQNDINLTKIESRPSNDDNWKYNFYVDLELPDYNIIEYFSKTRFMFENLKIIGIYSEMEK